MAHTGYYAPGQYNFTCDICGFRFKSGEMRRGFGANEQAVVCDKCQTPRQPQDFVRVLPDDQSVPIARPWIDPTVEAVWINNVSAIIPWNNGFGPIPWTP